MVCAMIARDTRRDRAAGADCASQDGQSRVRSRTRERVLANAVKPKLR
jgi:hypothetical protein